MASVSPDAGFIVWGVDWSPYGPVELPTLVTWVRDERVTADTWIFDARNGAWLKAGEMAELQMFFRGKSRGPIVDSDSADVVDPRILRRIKILSGMSDEQLARFAEFMEVEKVPQWAVVVKQGDCGDSMYFILDGELRVRMSVGSKETVLATMSAGEFFGDISLFDRGPRSADVVANKDSKLLKISASALDELSKSAPELATPFLRAIGQTLTARIRADNKRYGDSVRMAQAAG